MTIYSVNEQNWMNSQLWHNFLIHGNINNPNNPYTIGITFMGGNFHVEERVTFATANERDDAAQLIDDQFHNFIPFDNG